MNKLFFVAFLTLLFIFSSFTNKNSEKEIDKLLLDSNSKFVEINLYESLKLADKALLLSKEKDYENGIIKSNIYIAKVFNQLGIYEKAFEYLEEADKINSNIDLTMKVESYRLRGIIFGNLDINAIALDEFRKQLKLSSKIKNEKKQKLSIFWAYQNLAHLFLKLNEMDSAKKYVYLQKDMLSSFDKNKDYFNFSTAYTQVANYYISINNYNQGEVYLNKSLEILNQNKSPYLYYIYTEYGNLFKLKGDTNKAIDYYEKSIDNAKELNSLAVLRDNYKILAEYLVSQNISKEKASDYYYNYDKLNDSLEYQNKKVSDKILKYLIHKEKKQSIIESRYFYAVLIFFILLICSVFFYYKLKKVSLKKSEIKNRITAIETSYKSSITDTKFEKLIELLKGNHPEFLVLFKELYPEFIKELKALDPHIRSSELTFCAMLYLNFSTKDIAEFTFVTVRAVQIRKNRLRKKYNINSDEDINKWMRNLCKTNKQLVS